MKTAVIHVHYPIGDQSLVLRTSHDWDRDWQPASISDNRVGFRVTLGDQPLEFKPVVCAPDRLIWSRGHNYTIYPGVACDRHIYPHFHAHPFMGAISRVFCITADGRTVWFRVFTPAGYTENPLKRYPVLYMHDGTNLFHPREAFMGTEWCIDETMNLLNSLSLIDKTIVVGIHASDRVQDYTADGYEAYGGFVVDHLKPHIDAHYRTLTDAASTAVFGSSLGGVVSFYMAWQWPHVFGKAACMSSTFGYRDDLMQRVRDEPKRPVTFYLDSGWPNDNFEATKRMKDLLLHRGYQYGRDLLYFNFPHARHDEASWAHRVHVPIQYMFGKIPR